MAPVPREPVLVRPPQSRRAYAGVFAAAFSVLVVLTAVSAVRLSGALIPLLVVVVFDFACLRTLRLVVSAGADGLVVRNYLRSYTLAWDQVAGFKVQPPPSRLAGWELSVELASGQSLALDATRPLLRRDDDRDKAALEALRRRLQAWLG